MYYVLERGNLAAAWVISGQLVGATFCFAGANVGNGPGPEVVAFCAFLSTIALVFAWFVVERIASVADTITIDRHLGTGIRLCGWLIATGIVLGGAVTGSWKSVSGTVRDFAVYAWPAAAFALLMAFLERKLCALGPWGELTGRPPWWTCVDCFSPYAREQSCSNLRRSQMMRPRYFCSIPRESAVSHWMRWRLTIGGWSSRRTFRRRDYC